MLDLECWIWNLEVFELYVVNCVNSGTGTPASKSRSVDCYTRGPVYTSVLVKGSCAWVNNVTDIL